MNESIGACSAVAVLELSGSGAVAGDPGDAHAGGRSRRRGRYATWRARAALLSGR